MTSPEQAATEAGRRALGRFIRSRRERLSPADAGIPNAARRRTPGLRREEVAAISGISQSWYTWLEQGRDIKVSRQILSALAHTLQLSDTERRHLFRLAGELPPAEEESGTCPRPDEQLLNMLDALDPNPAFLLDQHWDLLGWNTAEAALIPGYDDLPPARRNMLWLLFGWPPAREVMVDWDRQASPVLAQFRMVAEEHPHDPRYAEIVEDLHRHVPDFSTWWERHEVADYRTVVKRYDHPLAGPMTLRQSKMTVADDPRIHLVARLPADPASAARLVALRDAK
ncbi:helix-turn-helix transcriptional regulator [Catenulispora subtropica]|uniref:Helix-turn-helix transcriptional regulator n=1 Tax=Catenulispora subtropica TaxID=450798 RepID=A0ABN2SIE3_9ACTN